MSSLHQEVRDVFVKMTRYPEDLFSLEADFEDELGIDSVKLAEIYAGLQKRFGVTANLDGVEVKNLGDVIALVEAHVGEPVGVGATSAGETSAAQVMARLGNRGTFVPTGGDARPIAPLADTDPKPDTPTPSIQQAFNEADVIAIFAEVTRYPVALFHEDADLEDDLGIDSVKQAEILAVLGKRFQLPNVTKDRFQDIHTVGDVIAALKRMTRGNAPNAAPTVTSVKAETQRPQPAVASQDGSHKPFAGKIAFISGSGHGIGAAIAKRLADQGAAVIVNSFHSRDRGEATADHIRKAGGQATHVWGSTAKADHLERIFAEIEDAHGGLDFFISNASNGLIAPLGDIQPEHWDRAFRTNVVGLHQGALLAAKLMDRRGGGRILAMSSPGAQRHIEHFGCMGPVKAAVESLVRYLAVEFADRNIAVNAISAGPVEGELLEKYPDSERLVPYWKSLSLGGQLATEEDIADAVTFFLSPAAAKISGSVQLLDATASLRI